MMSLVGAGNVGDPASRTTQTACPPTSGGPGGRDYFLDPANWRGEQPTARVKAVLKALED